jgi:prepilin-type N-terminal cleavage/methylation domain-containing protein/prepilin-type processing-associated H-X9-DG protein
MNLGNRTANRPTLKGFTLIELLIVIAIIAILAAILVPVFVMVREDGRKAACISNMKQISAAVLMYAQDFDETMPGISYSNFPYSPSADDPVQPASITCDSPKWMDVIQPYVKNDAVFNCPSDTFSDMSGQLWDGTNYNLAGNKRFVHQPYGPRIFRERDCGDSDGRTNVGKRFGSYGMNNVYWQYAYWTGRPEQYQYTPPQARPLPDIVVPSDTILIAEMAGIGPSAEFSRLNLTDDPQPDSAVDSFRLPILLNRRNRGGIVGRHHRRANVIWCDGHVKSETLNHLSQTRLGTRLMFRFTNQDD